MSLCPICSRTVKFGEDGLQCCISLLACTEDVVRYEVPDFLRHFLRRTKYNVLRMSISGRPAIALPNAATQRDGLDGALSSCGESSIQFSFRAFAFGVWCSCAHFCVRFFCNGRTVAFNGIDQGKGVLCRRQRKIDRTA